MVYNIYYIFVFIIWYQNIVAHLVGSVNILTLQKLFNSYKIMIFHFVHRRLVILIAFCLYNFAIQWGIIVEPYSILHSLFTVWYPNLSHPTSLYIISTRGAIARYCLILRLNICHFSLNARFLWRQCLKFMQNYSTTKRRYLFDLSKRSVYALDH